MVHRVPRCRAPAAAFPDPAEVVAVGMWRRFWQRLRQRPVPPGTGQRWQDIERDAARQRLLDQARRNARWPA
ncbi:hypothetical protein [Verrucosispora sp. WMMD1129]|uniref:hypothetical protein n=1 Tax=Verrucosispora sp. WMMD1129 TaxID=3016093 RepID=UPI00249C2024|nr:hypothetical protein [Verrucosispora sp. WMMD1129]WFE44262.1 hypothetical protein O7624_07900 [Verrucosispora sp. WMMD1129]